jgi:hypothetical protein
MRLFDTTHDDDVPCISHCSFTSFRCFRSDIIHRLRFFDGVIVPGPSESLTCCKSQDMRRHKRLRMMDLLASSCEAAESECSFKFCFNLHVPFLRFVGAVRISMIVCSAIISFKLVVLNFCSIVFPPAEVLTL